MKKISIHILLLLMLTAGAVAKEQDREIARLYAGHAWNAYGSSRFEEFTDLVSRGLEFDEQNPDLLSFRGMESRLNRDYGAAESWFQKAFTCGSTPEYVKTSDILAWLFEMKYRLGDDAGLVSLYQTINEMTRDNRDIYYYTVLSLHRLGREEEAEALARESVYRHQDQRFLILLTLWTGEESWPSMLGEYIKRQGLMYPDVLARAAIAEGKGDTRFLSSLYVSQKNDLNSWYMKKELLYMPVDESEIPDFTESSRVWPVQSLQAFIRNNPDMAGWMSFVKSLELDIRGDGNGDLFIRSRGDKVLWEFDFNQDGTADTRMVWNEDSRLERLEYLEDQLQRTFHYYDYPYIETVSLLGRNRNFRVYYYLPGSFSMSLEGEQEGLPVSLLMNPEAGRPVFTAESDLLKNCFTLIDSVTEIEDKPFREYTVVDGMIRRFREDSNFDGRFDRTVLLENWLPYEGYRDIDGDGDLDLKEKYIGGRFAGFEYNGRESRLEEFQDLWSRRRYQLWDFSKDGFYDALLEQRSDGSWEEMLIER